MICTPLTFALEMYNEVALKQDLGFKLLLTLFMYLYCPTEEADGAESLSLGGGRIKGIS